MTEYEQGFIDGEAAAWEGRNNPLPERPTRTYTERTRGYWDGRLPRSQEWALRQPTYQGWWCERTQRYVEAA